MKIVIDGIAFSGSPTDIVDALRELLFEETAPPDIEGYVAHIQHAYLQVFGREMVLPEVTLDGRIRAMFSILEGAGLMEVIEYA